MKRIIKTAISAVLLAPAALTLGGLVHAQDIGEHKFKFAMQTNPGTAQYDGAEKFAELVEQKSDGNMTVKIFGGGVLGGDLAVVSALQGGTIELSQMNASLLNGIVKQFSIFDFPYLFDNEKEAYAVLDGPVGQKLADMLPEKGIIGLSYPELGFRHVHNNVRPIKKLEDIAGLKIRVIQTPVYIDMMNALGANATPLPFPEVYTALETGTVDGATDPLVTIPVMKFDEVQKYLTLTYHMYNPQIIIASKKAWDELNAAEQDVLKSAAQEAATFEREVSQKKNAEAKETLKATMEITELPPEELARFKEKVQPVIEKYTPEVGQDLVDEVNAEIAKVRNGG